MTRKTPKPDRPGIWPTNITFVWENDRLSFFILDERDEKRTLIGWALVGSLNELVEKMKTEHTTAVSYALLTKAQYRRLLKTKKFPPGYPV